MAGPLAHAIALKAITLVITKHSRPEKRCEKYRSQALPPGLKNGRRTSVLAGYLSGSVHCFKPTCGVLALSSSNIRLAHLEHCLHNTSFLAGIDQHVDRRRLVDLPLKPKPIFIQQSLGSPPAMRSRQVSQHWLRQIADAAGFGGRIVL